MSVLKTVVGGLATLGVDTHALLQRLGLSRAELEDPSVWLPMDLHNRVWQEALTLTDDPLIGVRVAGLTSLDAYDVVGGVALHSATLGDAIVRLSRFGALLGAGFDVVLQVQGAQCSLSESRYDGPQLHLQGVLCQLCSYMLLAYQLTGTGVLPDEVHIAHPRPPFEDALRSVFRAPVMFDSDQNGLVFDSRLLHLPVLGHDPARLQSLDAHAEQLLRDLPRRPSLARAVEGLLSLNLGFHGIEPLARLMSLNSRTLMRRLAQEGTSYQEIRDRLRLQRAREYLERTGLSTCEIGLSLGFSDGTAFARAFRRWTGQTPTAYRKANPTG